MWTERIEALKAQHQWSDTDLATAVGISRQTLHTIRTTGLASEKSRRLFDLVERTDPPARRRVYYPPKQETRMSAVLREHMPEPPEITDDRKQLSQLLVDLKRDAAILLGRIAAVEKRLEGGS